MCNILQYLFERVGIKQHVIFSNPMKIQNNLNKKIKTKLLLKILVLEFFLLLLADITHFVPCA